MTTGQNNETYERTEAGDQSEVVEMMSSKGNINTASLPDSLSVESFSVVRGGSSQTYVSDISELQPTDLVNVGGMDVEYSVAQSMGLTPSIRAAIEDANANQAYKTQGGHAPDGYEVSDDEGYEAAQEAPETPVGNLLSNIEESVRSGDMSPSTASHIELLSDQAEMAGVGIEEMLGGFNEAFNRGGFDDEILSVLNLSEKQANDAMNNLRTSISSDISGFIGDRQYEQMSIWADRYPSELGSAMLDLSFAHAVGNASRSEWQDLWERAKNAYSDRA